MKKFMNEQMFCIKYTEKEKQSYVKRMKNMGVDRVILFAPRSIQRNEVRERNIEIMKENIAYMTEAGFEVAVNLVTIGFGETLEAQVIDDEKRTKSCADGITRLHDFYGNNTREAYCPEDPILVESLCGYLQDIARAGARIIILDDDLCMNIRPGLGCTCHRHLKLLEDMLGEPLTREDILNKVFCGGPNKYREGWMRVMGDTLRNFCRRLRAAVDEVDSTIRMGQMLSYTNWDLEGADAIELAKILAGNNRPIMRLSGAPYWVASIQRFRHMGMELPAIIEFVRLQEEWCKGSGIELFDENDNFPRPRTHCPAALNECYDLCLTASGEVEGFLHECEIGPEYLEENAEYKTGYEREHVINAPKCTWLLENFSGESEGLRVYEHMRKVAYTTFPEKFAGQQKIMDTAFSPAQSFVANLSIPTKLAGEDNVGVAFGVVPHFMSEEERKGNLILDAIAAAEIQKAGIDVGFHSITLADAPNEEYFPEDEMTITLYFFAGKYYRMELKKGAKVISWFKNGDAMMPAAYQYENAAGQRFLVYAFDSFSIREDSDTFTSRNRQKQLLKSLSWLGKKLCAECPEHPGLYFIARRDGGKLCIAVCNIFMDWARGVTVKLDRNYASVESMDGNVVLEGETARITEDIPPYGFVGFTVREKE